MIAFTDVADAIHARIAGEWPERMIYHDVCPSDFKRPSFLLVCRKTTVDREIALLSMSAQFELTLHDEKDEYYNASSARLMAVQTRILSLFASEDLPVGDRHVTVTAQADGSFVSENDDFRALVQFTVTWMDCDDEDEEVLPEMETFHVNTYLESNPQPDADLEEGSD